MNFTATSNSHHRHHRANPVLRVGSFSGSGPGLGSGLGSAHLTSLMIKPSELIQLKTQEINQNHHHNKNQSQSVDNHYNRYNSNGIPNGGVGGNGGNGGGGNSINFLNISKAISRVPDIQMINKYYGLVPKKFIINQRTDLR